MLYLIRRGKEKTAKSENSKSRTFPRDDLYVKTKAEFSFRRHSITVLADREINMMQQYLLELENTMAKTRTEKYAEVFVRAITYAKYLERLNALHDKEPGHLSTLFVKLFVHAPYTKISESLEEISAKIYHVRFDLDRCDFDNKKIHLQEIKEKMVKIMDAIGTLERRSAQILYEIEEKIVEGKVKTTK